MSLELKNLGVALGDVKLVEEYYTKLRAIFIHTFSERGLVLDLSLIHPELKSAVIKWLIAVNLPRLKAGEEPLLPLSLVLKCPVWKIVKPPLRRVTMTKEGLFNQPKIVKKRPS